MKTFTTLEDRLLKEYWNQNPGLLLKEVKIGETRNERRAKRIDGVLIPQENKKVYSRNRFGSEKIKSMIDEKSIKVIEVKKKLNRDVIGQVDVASFLIKKEFNPKEVSRVIICGETNQVLERYCGYKEIEVYTTEGLEKICTNFNTKQGKYKDKIEELLKDTPVFTNRDVNMVIKDRSYTDLFLHNLVEQGEAFRLKRGCYSWEEDPFLSVFCFRPAYLGLEFALTFHEIWDQETNPVIITPRKVRTGTREVLGTNIVLRHIKQDYFFGIDFLKHDDFYLPVSDIEKTILDFVYFNNIPTKEVWRKLLDKADREKLLTYTERYPPRKQVKIKNAIDDVENSS